MKGLLKGFRYFSQIFDGKEEEMQIGYPTDVKHVAHIGWDGGPSVNPPSWMNEFRSAPLSALGAEAMSNQSPAQVPSDDSNRGRAEVPDSPLRELPDQLVPKPRRQSSASSAMPADSATGSPGVPKHSRRNKSATAIPVDQPEGDPPSSSSRRHAGSIGGGSSVISTPTDSPVRDLPSIPKVGRKKKAKAAGGGAPGGASSRSGKPRAQAPLSDGGEADGWNGENALVIASSPVRGEGMM